MDGSPVRCSGTQSSGTHPLMILMPAIWDTNHATSFSVPSAHLAVVKYTMSRSP
jgi:hypothetical protein